MSRSQITDLLPVDLPAETSAEKRSLPSDDKSIIALEIIEVNIALQIKCLKIFYILNSSGIYFGIRVKERSVSIFSQAAN